MATYHHNYIIAVPFLQGLRNPSMLFHTMLAPEEEHGGIAIAADSIPSAAWSYTQLTISTVLLGSILL